MTRDPIDGAARKTRAARFIFAVIGVCVTGANIGVQAQAPSRRASESAGAPRQSPGTLQLGGTSADPAATQIADPQTARVRPTVTAVRVDVPPSIDGRLDDAAWQRAARITDFVQQRPIEGAPATEQTEVLIAYDSRNVYFGIYAHYSDAGLIRASRVERDRTGRDDTVSVFFDPFLDQQRAYVFSVNGFGVQGDAIMGSGPGGPGGGGPGRGGGGGGGRGGGPGGGGGGEFGQDSSWDALFSTKGQLVADGWVAEMAIPFKSLRYPSRPAGESHRWGFQIQRDIDSKNESVVWAPVSRDIMGFLGQMGVLDGITNVSMSRNLEILPQFTAIKAGAVNTTSGAFDSLDAKPKAGVNVKYGVTSNVTVDFTLNPDFSQIESDRAQIEVNQRFPLFFPELRPFFLEGQEIFQINGPVTFVHTRTIVDPLFGAKITGKVGKTTLGVLVANDQAPGKIDDPADPGFDRSAQILIARVRYDLYSESHIGVITTDREFVDSYSRLAGVDGQFRIGRNHRLVLRAFGSDRLEPDGARRNGPMFDVSFRKEGRNLSYGIVHWEVDPDFGTSVGFVRRTDVRQTNFNGGYRWWPQHWIINWGPRAQYSRNYNFAGDLDDDQSNVSLGGQFAKNINLNAGISRDMERFGGIRFWQTRSSLGGNVNTNRKVGFGAFMTTGDQIRYVTDPFLGRGTTINAFVTLRPAARLQAEVDLNSSRFVDPRTNTEAFDVKLLRALTTYQFTDRLLARNITEYNSQNKTIALNLLMTYRVNSGTVFYVGYDDHYRQGNQIDATLFPTSAYRRTNRAFFTKLQYLFRY